MDCIKRKSTFKHKQTVRIHIIMDMRNVSFGRLLSIHYENKPIQIYWKIYQKNMKQFR